MDNSKTQIESAKNLKNYLFTSENFNLLRQAQETIFQKTGWTPSIKKLVNAIVNGESIEKLTAQFIENLQ